MFARVTDFQSSPDRLDGLITIYKEQLVPTLRALPGYVGAALLVDRAGGAGHAISYWDSPESMQASEDAAVPLRAKAAEGGSQIGEVDRFELIIQERTGPPRANTFVRVTEMQASPAKVDEVTAMIRDRALPKVRSQQGFRALLMAANRQTGRIVASSVWETAADREASEAAIQEDRRAAGQLAGGGPVKVELFDSVFVEVKQAARA
jgi:heme-degrading monooxygenase HmoA